MQEEKNRIERVLGATLSPELIQKVLTFALSVSYKFISRELLLNDEVVTRACNPGSTHEAGIRGSLRLRPS